MFYAIQFVMNICSMVLLTFLLIYMCRRLVFETTVIVFAIYLFNIIVTMCSLHLKYICNDTIG